MMRIEGQIVDLINERIFPGCIMISEGKIVSVEPMAIAPDRFLLPGFIDAHVHIESSMVLPSRFAESAVAHGTVGVVSDPHEIANVMGEEGVDYMIADGATVPFHFFFGAPSCVPATPFDHSGAVLGPAAVDRLLGRKDIWFLSEMMNFPGVIHRQPDVMQKLESARKFGKPIDGHAPGLSGDELKTYTGEGITTDHETFSLEEGREKIAQGMIIQIREGSAARNFDVLHPLIKEFPGKVMFCTDDCHPNDLLKGHINRIVIKALQMGYPLFDVLKAASMTPRNHYGLPIGLLQPGDPADFIIVDNLNELNVVETWIQGNPVFFQNKPTWKRADVNRINHFVSRAISLSDIEIMTNRPNPKIRVIEAIDGELITHAKEMVLQDVNGYLVSDPLNDILKIVVVNRYNHQKPSIAFVKGFGLNNGAIAGSIAHDSHNLIAVGVNDSDIIKALQSLIASGGGIVTVSDGIVDRLDLPVGGLMSTDAVEQVATHYEDLQYKVTLLGSRLKAPFMTLAFMSLLVIPALKIGDAGLFDVSKFQYVPLFVD